MRKIKAESIETVHTQHTQHLKNKGNILIAVAIYNNSINISWNNNSTVI